MGALTLYGTTVTYEDKDYGVLYEETDEKGQHFVYSGFFPSSLGDAARAFSRDKFIRHLEGIVELSQEPRDWEVIWHGCGWVSDEKKSATLRNTRALLAEILEALGKE